MVFYAHMQHTAQYVCCNWRLPKCICTQLNVPKFLTESIQKAINMTDKYEEILQPVKLYSIKKT